MKTVIKKILCELLSGDKDLKCEKCIELYQKQCERYANKILIAVSKNKEKLC